MSHVWYQFVEVVEGSIDIDYVCPIAFRRFGLLRPSCAFGSDIGTLLESDNCTMLTSVTRTDIGRRVSISLDCENAASSSSSICSASPFCSRTTYDKLDETGYWHRVDILTSDSVASASSRLSRSSGNSSPGRSNPRFKPGATVLRPRVDGSMARLDKDSNGTSSSPPGKKGT